MEAEAIIVGAGPAGTAAAHCLALAGVPLLWLDRPATARPKPCAGGVTPKAAQLLPGGIDAVVRERTALITMSWRGHRASPFTAPGDVCLLTHRPELDQWHREQAMAAGAVPQAISAVRSLKQHAGGVSLTVCDEAGTARPLRARWLIAADGAHSPLRRLVCGQAQLPVAMAIEGLVPRSECRHWPGMCFDFGAVPAGYGWLFPKGDHMNVGLYRWRPGAGLSQAALAAYARRRLGTDRLGAVQGYPITAHGDRMRLTAGRVLFTGDAAGLAEPLLGEGIYGALLSGRQAALAVMAGSQAAAVYEQAMASWRRELAQTRQLSRLFYGTLPLAFGVLVHGLRRPVMHGMADGLTLMQSWRRCLTPARRLSPPGPAGGAGAR